MLLAFREGNWDSGAGLLALSFSMRVTEIPILQEMPRFSLVGGFNVSTHVKNMFVKIGWFPQIGVKIPKIWEKPPPNIKMDGFGGTTILDLC